MNIFMKEVADASHVDHFYSPIYNLIFRIKNPFWKYAENLNHFKLSILIPIIENGRYIKKLRIHSHGNKNPPKFYNKKGPVIRMGDDNLSLYDFDGDGNPHSGLAKDFLISLKNVLTKDAKIIFDSCNQGSGELLKNISKFLGENITVIGFSGFGAPFIKGDLIFCNGVRKDINGNFAIME